MKQKCVAISEISKANGSAILKKILDMSFQHILMILDMIAINTARTKS